MSMMIDTLLSTVFRKPCSPSLPRLLCSISWWRCRYCARTTCWYDHNSFVQSPRYLCHVWSWWL